MHLPDFAGRFRSGSSRNMLTMVSGSVIGQLIALAAYPVITRLYNPAEFGTQSVFMTLGLLASAVATGRYEQGLLLPKEDRRAGRMLLLVLFVTTIISALIAIPSIFYRKEMAHLLGSDDLEGWLPMVPIYTWLLAMCTTFTLYANRYGKFRLMAGYQIAQSTGTAGLRLGLSGIGGSGLIAGTILGQLFGFLVLGIPQFKKTKKDNKHIKPEEITSVAKEYANFPRFKMPGVFVTFLSSNLPIFALSSFFSPAISGFYSLAYTTVFRPMNLFINSISQVFAQQFIQQHHDGKNLSVDLHRFVRRLFAIGIGPFVLAFLFSPWLFSVIFGKDWETAGSYLRWMLPWLFMVYLYSGINFIPDMFNRQRKAMILDSTLLILRIIALGTGILLQNAYLAIVLFSLTGLTINSYCFWWYFRLVHQHDKSLR